MDNIGDKKADPKILIEIDGTTYDDSSIVSFALFWEDGLLRMQITTNAIKEDVPKEEYEKPKMDKPVAASIEESALPKKDYEKLIELSVLRQYTKIVKDTKFTIKNVDVGSEEYDIIDIKGIKNAIEEIAGKENQFYEEGYRFSAEVQAPTLVFKDGDSGKFYLKEKIALFEVQKNVKPEAINAKKTESPKLKKG